MYVEHRKPYRRPISLRNEIDLLLHCPFGGLIGEGLLPYDYTSAAPYKISVKAKQAGRNKNIKHYWDFKNIDFFIFTQIFREVAYREENKRSSEALPNEH
jgi:hypothetical protein